MSLVEVHASSRTWTLPIGDETSGKAGARTVVKAFWLLSFSSIFLQKFGVTLASSSIGLDAFILWGVLAWLFLRGAVGVNATRFALFAVMTLLAVVATVVTGASDASVPSLLLFLSLYATLTLQANLPATAVLACLRQFQTMMGLIAIIVIAQQAIQFTVGAAWWPNLDTLLPHQILLQGFAYIRPYEWKSPYLTPNGVFFLEPSAVSLFLAMATAVEIRFFQSKARLILLGSSLLACMAGTGLAALVACAPFLASRLRTRALASVCILAIPALAYGFSQGYLDHILDRSSEFFDSKKSAYARISKPLEETISFAGMDSRLMYGDGPGASAKGNDEVQWPANKLGREYGLLTAAAFHVFVGYAALANPISAALSLCILIPHFFFGGGFVQHTNIMLLVMFCTLLHETNGDTLANPHERRKPNASTARSNNASQ